MHKLSGIHPVGPTGPARLQKDSIANQKQITYKRTLVTHKTLRSVASQLYTTLTKFVEAWTEHASAQVVPFTM